ncbi:MAG: type I asparaginase [Bacteroides sp.]|nr:type I asparaginase [Bacteroides sp.]MCM1095905.1 type I asparaginase [Terasakiella sp.]
MKKPRILIIYTGGTIGMIEDPRSKALRPFDFSHLMENVPKVKMLDYEIDNIQFAPPLDSSDMQPPHWQHIARSIARNYDAYDGFVVLHGTDTMAYTASALSFMLQNLGKPVIITGSQLPIGEVRTDGEENLITALQIAASRERDGAPTVQEVAILFENYLWRGNRSTKRSADHFNAFKSSNYPYLAKIGLDIRYNRDVLSRGHSGDLRVHTELDTAVMCIDVFPGLTESTLRHQLSTPGIKGIVLRTYGAGNAPTAPWFVEAIRDTCRRGVIVFNITQCLNGGVHSNRYEAGDILAATGVVPGHDITFEAAVTKLMHLFALDLGHDEVARRLVTPLAGEMTVAD